MKALYFYLKSVLIHAVLYFVIHVLFDGWAETIAADIWMKCLVFGLLLSVFHLSTFYSLSKIGLEDFPLFFGSKKGLKYSSAEPIEAVAQKIGLEIPQHPAKIETCKDGLLVKKGQSFDNKYNVIVTPVAGGYKLMPQSQFLGSRENKLNSLRLIANFLKREGQAVQIVA